jgi:predicted dehydrogenase
MGYLDAMRAELRLALVGCGGQAGGDVPNLANHPAVKIVAVCDPDKKNRDKFGDTYGASESARFAQYKQLLASVECDAVFCATPDHMHAPVGLAALRKNKHVYLQKPLARSVGECRALAEEARRRPKLATQMGIQIHGHPAYQTAITWLKSGILGRVREVHSFCQKGWGGPQPMLPADPVPAGLDWDAYCGISPLRPYKSGAYHPGNWRRWQALGTGTLGDMACHILDPVFGGLGLGKPKTVLSHLQAHPNPENFAYDMHVELGFENGPTVHWYNGAALPPASVLPGVELQGSGSVLIGEKGRMLLPHWATPTLYDDSGELLPRRGRIEPEVNHYHEWVDAALSGNPAACGADFAYSANLTESVLLGNIAAWQPGKTLTWDGPRCRFVGEGAKEANRRLFPAYRRGVRL